MADNRPIGVFDSGIGGLTVLREIWNLMPGEGTIYFGDNGRAPYGTKSKSTVIKYSLQNMRFLEEQNVKMIVIACNTASAHAYHSLTKNSSVPVIEVVTPGAIAAAGTTRNGKIGKGQGSSSRLAPYSCPSQKKAGGITTSPRPSAKSI